MVRGSSPFGRAEKTSVSGATAGDEGKEKALAGADSDTARAPVPPSAASPALPPMEPTPGSRAATLAQLYGLAASAAASGDFAAAKALHEAIGGLLGGDDGGTSARARGLDSKRKRRGR